MRELHAHTPKALNEWDVEAIHQARVATRRVKAALDLADPLLAKKRRQRLARALRKLRRRLGPMRDTDVILEHLHDIALAQPRHAPAVEWLSVRLERQRETLRQDSRAKGPATDMLADLASWQPVREQLAAGHARFDALLGQSLHRQLDSFASQADRIVKTTSGDAGADREDPHALRIAGKALRYTLEMAAVQGHAVPASVMKAFKRMQELLGAWHDFVVLSDQALRTSLDELLAHRDPALQQRVLDLARLTLRRSALRLRQFARLWSKKGGALTAAVRGTFPQAPAEHAGDRILSESNTGPGRTGSAEPTPRPSAPPDAPSNAS